MIFALIVTIAVLFALADAHGRWKCPLPRDVLDDNGNYITFDNTENKFVNLLIFFLAI